MRRVMKNFFITTAINYTNGSPHIGHAYEAILADIFARYHKSYGREVFFLTGTDEHGLKIASTAQAQGLEPIALCDKYVAEFKMLNQSLNISYDFFIRTTMPRHMKVAQKIYVDCKKNGDVYLGKYVGWYSVREERFITDSEAEAWNYKDPSSGKELTKMEEPSYFFKLSKYKGWLMDYIKTHPHFIQPQTMHKHILCRLENEELKDLSISRTKQRLSWGIPLPDDDNHVMYVWFDALTNYLTGLNYDKEEKINYWPPNVHLIGKDIVWFHCVIWPAMLKSAGQSLPKAVLSHGFIMDERGEKMSKSIGNVIDPFEMVKKYGSDVFRFYLASTPLIGDLSFSVANLEQMKSSILADDLGNLVNRVVVLTNKYSDSIVPKEISENLFDVVKLVEAIDQHFTNYDIHLALEVIVSTTKSLNKYLTEKAPWNKGDISYKKTVIKTALEGIYILAHLYSAVLVDTASKVTKILGHDLISLTQLKQCCWKALKPNTKIQHLNETLFSKKPEMEEKTT